MVLFCIGAFQISLYDVITSFGTIKVKKQLAAATGKAFIYGHFESKLVICYLFKKNDTFQYQRSG